MPQEMSVSELRRIARLHKGLTPESWLMDWAANEIERLRNQVDIGQQVVNCGVVLMTKEQIGQWLGVRHFLEAGTEMYAPLEEGPNVEVSGLRGFLRRSARLSGWARVSYSHLWPRHHVDELARE